MKQVITLGGGCFWCTEAVFEQVQGVHAVESGYCNGHFPNPSYEQVCTGQTGHAEVVRVEFDDALIPLRDILAIFFATHDPTTPNRQGHDVGPQYRSGIYVSDEEQAEVAHAVVAEVQQALGGRVVTEVVPLSGYSRAEDYHQHYYARNPYQGYCAAVISPKLAKFRRVFAQRLKPA
ncbi:MAG: peptide-methionine (S)-S-oxide reductase MsrA [Betaproteobacteria bacterium]|jgi:peptide-methionine (S)-S-oxide reductase